MAMSDSQYKEYQRVKGLKQRLGKLKYEADVCIALAKLVHDRDEAEQLAKQAAENYRLILTLIKTV